MAPDMGLDLKLSTAARIIGNVSKDSDQQTRISRLEQHIGILEVEKRKIEVFKRELPLCIYLLDDAILTSKEKVEQWKKENLEQLMTTNVKVEEEEEEEEEEEKKKKKIEMKLEGVCKEKMNWMSTAQLWSNNHNDTKINKKSGGESKCMLENKETKKKKKTVGCAFVRKDDRVSGRSLDLSLVPVAVDDARSSGPEPTASCHVSLQSLWSQQQAQRKARRCWSPELHRYFVAALQQLGGRQVATPKRIRELMKVDGLTNDEVKSHLQKYRIHTRRIPTRGAGSHGVMVAMGGLWVEPESYSSSEGSPQGSLKLSGSSRTISVTASESCEDDSRSEDYKWK